MVDESIINIFETFSMIGILLSFLIFIRLAVKARSIGSFRFQLSIFMLLWAIAEIPHVLETIGYIAPTAYDTAGLYFHFLSMASFALFVGWRSIGFLRHTPAPSQSPTDAVSSKTSPYTQKPRGFLDQ